MKNSLLVLLVVVFSLAACSKPEADEQTKPVGDVRELTVIIEGDPATRVVEDAVSGESMVNDLQILVFEPDGTLVGYKRAGAVVSTSVLSTVGTKLVWAVVNGPALDTIRSVAELEAVSTSLGENSIGDFVMTGSAEVDLQETSAVSIIVRRMVARVSISKISTAFASSGVADIPLKINSIYMVNVPQEVTLFGTLTVSSWANKLGHVDSGLDHLLYDEVDQVLDSKTPYVMEHVFYPYPNPVEDDSVSSLWNPRKSILCVEVEMDGRKGYYSIMMPVLERNRMYVIRELVITRNPGSEPYIPVESAMISVSMEVNPWDSALSVGTIVI